MDKVKYVRLEQVDGSYSDPIPLSTDSDYINFNNETLTVRLNRAPYYYNTIAEMKADNKLRVGDLVFTLGYYQANDGGGAKYQIIDGTYTDNGGSIHKINNNLYAEIILENNTISAEQFGLIGDGITDNSSKMNKLLSFKGNDYIKIIFSKNKIYGMQKIIYFYSNTEIDLNQATIKCIYTGGPDDPSVKTSNGLKFYANVDSVKIPGYGAIKNFSIYNGTIDGGNSGVTFAMLHGENFIWKDIKFLNCCVGTHIVDMGGCKDFTFENCNFTGSWITGSNYYREMLQPDYAGYNNLPYWGNDPSYAFDLLPTINLTVKNCNFEKGNGTHYPNAIGTHSTSASGFSENILIEDCTFHDCSYSAIRLPHCKNVRILNNTFYNENPNKESSDMYMINIKGLNNTYPGSQDILIKGNTFKSLLGNENGNDNTIFIGITAHANNSSWCKNIKIIENEAFGTYQRAPEDMGKEGSTVAPIHSAQDFLQVNNVEELEVSNNKVIQMKQLIYINSGPEHLKNVKVKNNYMENMRLFVRIGDDASLTSIPIKNCIIDNNVWAVYGTDGETLNTYNLNHESFTYSFEDVSWQAENSSFQNIPLNVGWKTNKPNEIEIDGSGMIKIPHYFKRYKFKISVVVSFDNHYGTPEQIVTSDGGAWWMNMFCRQYENLGIHVIEGTGFSIVPTGNRLHFPKDAAGEQYVITWESPVIDNTQYWTTSKHFYYAPYFNLYPTTFFKRFIRNTNEAVATDTLGSYFTIEMC